MWIIKDIFIHGSSSSDEKYYTAVLYDQKHKEGIDVILAQSGSNFIAFEEKTDLLHHLDVSSLEINSLEELKNGDIIKIICSIPKS